MQCQSFSCLFFYFNFLIPLWFSGRVCSLQPVSATLVNTLLAMRPKEKVQAPRCHLNTITSLWHVSQLKKMFVLSTSLGIQWSNLYTSPIAADTASFSWLCWLMLIDSILYFIIGAYIRMVFPGKLSLIHCFLECLCLYFPQKYILLV